MTLPEKSLQDLSDFFAEDVLKKIFNELHRVLCYVPNINSDNNTNHQNLYGDGGQGLTGHYKRYGKEDFKRRQNYQCFSVNKWRYKSSRAFVKFVEENCAPLMEKFGYKLIGNNEEMIKDMKIPLVQPMFISSAV